MKSVIFGCLTVLLYALPSTAQTCSIGTTVYQPGQQVVEKRRPSTTPSTVTTRTGQGWTLAHTDQTVESGLAYNYLVFVCPIPPTPPADCIPGDWQLSTATTWSACTVSSTQTRSETWQRGILSQATNGGSCDVQLQETRVGTQSCVYIPPPTPIPPPSDSAHPYFSKLTQRPELFKAYALRTDTQLVQLAQSATLRKWVTYDAGMDAAKVVIPDYDPDIRFVLADPLDTLATTLHLAVPTGSTQTKLDSLLNGYMTTGRSLRINGAEVVTVQRVSGVSITGGFVPVKRAVPVAHAAGEVLSGSVTSLINQVRLPLGTEDGHSYLFTWDSWQTSSLFYKNTAIAYFKTWQFSNANNLWLEVASRYDGTYGNWTKVPGWNTTTDVTSVGLRSYNNPGGGEDWTLTNGNLSGPGVTATGSLAPQVAPFVVKPDRWVRYWVQIEQRANDYDYVSMWAADFETGPVLLVNRVPLSLPANGNSIQTFWLEYNTSFNGMPAGRGPLTFYARNFVALRDVADINPLLEKPAAQPTPQPAQ